MKNQMPGNEWLQIKNQETCNRENRACCIPDKAFDFNRQAAQRLIIHLTPLNAKGPQFNS